MELKNIFKMEIFKNRNDKPYLLVIAILTAMAAVASIAGVLMIEASSGISTLVIIEVILAFFTVIGLFIFFLLYPFHLLNVDYKNKVMSLIFASGVSRGKYYFVKISATILSTLFAAFVILLIPMVTFFIVYPNIFVEAVQNIVQNFNSSDIISVVLSATIGLVANLVMLTTAVIITKGKTSGIFLFFGFLLIVSIIQPTILFSSNLFLGMKHTSTNFYLDAGFSIVKIIAFALIGLNVLKKQDL
jgi:hypothetical protein